MSKPVNWDSLPPKVKRDLANDMVRTARGRYILSEALWYGTKLLRSMPVQANISEIEDMEMLREVFQEFQPTQGELVSLKSRKDGIAKL